MGKHNADVLVQVNVLLLGGAEAKVDGIAQRWLAFSKLKYWSETMFEMLKLFIYLFICFFFLKKKKLQTHCCCWPGGSLLSSRRP